TKNLIHGHECDAAACLPGFGTPGSDTSYPIPAIGVGDGDRLANTDVLTFRFIAGAGQEVASIAGNVIQLSNFATTLPGAINPLPANSRVLVASCTGATPLVAADVVASGGGSITVNIPSGQKLLSSDGLTRVFNLDRDVRSITYFVANNIVDGRSIPTLYSVNNGTVNALIEGVDRFDVLYGVGTGIGTGATPTKQLQYLTATQVQNLPAVNCRPLPNEMGNAGFINDVGCGWRGVETIQIHLLLNTVQDSTHDDNIQFMYSMLDNLNLQSPSNLGTGIDTYRLHRKEFYASIALKNSQK
ncbi:hypothetical protein MNBD_GAMMA01-2326, partial [hydrothermal vent metagenome]